MDNIAVEFSDTSLSIITTEGLVSNINYKKEKDLVHSILTSIPATIESTEWIVGGDEKTYLDILILHLDVGDIKIANIDGEDMDTMEHNYVREFESTRKLALDPSILRIGCNYGEFTSSSYIALKMPLRKTNRGRKKKAKKLARRKGIGLRRYFNSEITFTVLVDPSKAFGEITKDDALYHMKLYTNGKIQVPSVRSNDVYVIEPTVWKIIEMVRRYPDVVCNETEDCKIEYIKSIMRNYKFSITDESILIDIKRFKHVVIACKRYFEGETNPELLPYDVTVDVLESYRAVITKHPCVLIKYNNDKYVGFILKFSTPVPDYPNRNTTVKIFHSGKFNVDACNTLEQGEEVKDILLALLRIASGAALYRINNE